MNVKCENFSVNSTNMIKFLQSAGWFVISFIHCTVVVNHNKDDENKVVIMTMIVCNLPHNCSLNKFNSIVAIVGFQIVCHNSKTKTLAMLENKK